MIWGVEGRHVYMPPTDTHTPAQIAVMTPAAVTAAGGVILNRRVDDAGVDVWPVYWVNKIGGLMSLGESDDSRQNRVGAEGEIPRRSFRRGKTITYEGNIRALTRLSLRTAEELLRVATHDQTDEGMVVVTPHPTYDGSGHYCYYPARCLTAEITDEITVSPARASRGHESGFVVALRNSRAGGFSYFDQAAVGHP